MDRTTRFLVAVTFFAMGVIFSPETFGSNSPKLPTFIKLAHLLCFSTAWGAALWFTFIAVTIMFRNLPRHQFGNLQSKMFPAYFSMLGVCCAVSVASFGYLHPWKSSSTPEKYQLGVLLSAFAFNLTNRFVFTPMTIKVVMAMDIHISQACKGSIRFSILKDIECWGVIVFTALICLWVRAVGIVQ